VRTSAEKVYNDLDVPLRELARHLFLLLISVGREGRLVRLQMTDADLYAACAAHPAADVDAVLAAFTAVRLMVRGEENTEIAHDVLLRAWPRLRGWIDSGRADRVLYDQLIDDVKAWVKHQEDPSFLYRGTRLVATERAIERWRADPVRYPGVVNDVHYFLDACRHAAARNRRYQRYAFTAMAVFLVAALVGATLAGTYAADVARQRDQAISRQLAADSDKLAGTAPVTAALLAAAAWDTQPTDQARHSMLNVLTYPN
jgi:hypothetical protein